MSDSIPSLPVTTDEKIEEFLGDLTALCLHHGLWILGCGCCGSPFLAAIDPRTTHALPCGYVVDNNSRFLAPVERRPSGEIHAGRHRGLHPHAYDRPPEDGAICAVLTIAHEPEDVH